VARDYEILGVPYEDAQQRLIEALDVVLKAWTGEPIEHHGRYYDFSNVELWPPTEQQPHPPIWFACSNSPTSFEFVGTRGYQLLTIGYLRPLAALAELTKIYRHAWAESGHTGPTTIGTHYHVVVAEDRADARRLAEGGLREHVRLNRASQHAGKAPAAPANEGISIEQLVDEGRLIAGTPDDCAATLRRVASEIGCTEAHCLFQFGDIPFDAAQRSLELFARHVIPQLREVGIQA
jgi:alkanesulfonate monooxygenase SsuD/methylene tetrahydromethanopterin reductase-like flavin-dependent oxidoreductase (luciferase family)